MQRGEVWLCDLGGKVRPVVVISRNQVHARLRKVSVIPISGQKRGWPDEIEFEAGEAGLAINCVAQCREIAHIPKTALRQRIGDASHRLPELCRTTRAVIGCS